MSDLEITIERVVAGGLGLARTGDGVVLVRGGLPGERVRARVETRKGHRSGAVLEVLEPHPQRESRPLPSGADLPLAYEAQLPIKESLVSEALSRIGRIDHALEPIAASPSPVRYRTAAQYAVVRGGGLAGREPGSRTLVPLDDDPLIAEPLRRAFDRLASIALPDVGDVLLRGSVHEDRALVGLAARNAGAVRRVAGELLDDTIAGVAHAPARTAAEKARTLAGAPGLLEDFGGIVTTVTVRSFAQVNPAAAGLLYREARGLAGDGERALDLYAGSGVLAMHLAQGFGEVVAVEISADAIRRGNADRKRLGIDNLRFVNEDAASLQGLPRASLVSVNPPRAGIAQEVVDEIASHAPDRVLYVSCDPPSWARDVSRLAAKGYRLTFARPYDFYPYTHHVEVLSMLERG